MLPPETPKSFHVRFIAGLRDKLEMARGRRSLNEEINERLQRSFGHDDASRLAEEIRPIIKNMADDDRARFVDLIAEMVKLIDRTGRKK